jgi:hypothetical protein
METSDSSQTFPNARQLFTHENKSTKGRRLDRNSTGILTVTREIAPERGPERAVTYGHSAHGGNYPLAQQILPRS